MTACQGGLIGVLMRRELGMEEWGLAFINDIPVHEIQNMLPRFHF